MGWRGVKFETQRQGIFCLVIARTVTAAGRVGARTYQLYHGAGEGAAVLRGAAWERSEGCHFLSHDPGSVRCRDAREGAGELILYLSFW